MIGASKNKSAMRTNADGDTVSVVSAPARLRRAKNIAPKNAVLSAENIDSLPTENLRQMLHELRSQQVEMEMRNGKLQAALSGFTESSKTEEALKRANARLLHELQVHQIELEVQNETLRETQIGLQESRDRFVDFYELSPVGYLTVTDKGLIAAINLTGATLLGVDRGMLLQRPFARFVAPADVGHWKALLASVLSQRNMLVCELTIGQGDALKTRARLDCLRLVRDGEPVTVRIVLTDISERKGLEDELQRTSNRLHAIASKVPGMMFELMQRGAERRFNFVSEGARTLFGIAEETQAFETLVSIVREVDRESFLRSLEHSARQLSLWNWIGQVIDPNGELRWVQFHATVKRGEDGRLCWDGIATDVTEAKKSELALTGTRQLLRDISIDRETVREEERIRIARELHDELGQLLTGVKLHLSAMALRLPARSAQLKTQARYIMQQVEQAMVMTRNTVQNLRPPALDQGLAAAIAWLASQFTQRSGIGCAVNLPQTPFALDEIRAIALFRVLQESLTNITRHAGASRASIEVQVIEGRLRLRVIDNGKGFLEPQVVVGRSFGLLGMRERVQMLGGSIEIISTEGFGTTVVIDVALEAAA